MIEEHFITIIEVIGTFAFAVSGIRLAAYKNFDLFGAYTIGLVTAIGGGTLRDLLLDQPPFWMLNWLYLGVTGASLAIVVVFRAWLVSMNKTLFIFDTVGLALFVVIGISKTLSVGYDMWVAVIMGMITGSFGGVMRDILINEMPLFFRKDIYATACIAGGVIYWILTYLTDDVIIQQSACAVTVIALRMFAIHYNWSLPVLRYTARERLRSGNPYGDNEPPEKLADNIDRTQQ